MAIYIPFSVDSPQQWSVSTPSQTHNTLDWPGPVPGFLASELVPCSAAAPVTSRQVFGSSPRDLGTTKSNPLRNGRLANTDQLATMPQDATGSAQKDVGVIPPPAKRRRCEVPVARYGSMYSNIFLQMQDTEIPREEEDPYVVIPARLPAPDDYLLDAEDAKYLRLFVDNGKWILRPLGLFFPTACEQIFTTSLESTPLRHAIIAIAMHYAQRTFSRHCMPSRLDKYLETFSHRSQFSLVRKDSKVQDAEILAGFLILTLTLVRLSETREVDSLRRQVEGLYALFDTAQKQTLRCEREALSPLLFSIWRQTMRINVTFALGVEHNPDIFPPPAHFCGGRPAHGHGPIRQYLGGASREFEAWTLAQLELDDLGSRIFRMHLRASAVRSMNPPDPLGEPEILLNTQQLVWENERWRQKPVIQVAEYVESLYRQQPTPEPPPEKTFLHYPPIRFKNPLYACLLLTHYAMTISLSLIVDPKPGPRKPDRVEAAIEICRIYASLGGNHPVGSLTCLASVWWAGLTFDSKRFPAEARWVRNQLADPIHRGLGMRYLTHLKVVWKKAQRSWDVWTKFPKNEDWS